MPKWFSDEARERDSKKYYVVITSDDLFMEFFFYLYMFQLVT